MQFNVILRTMMQFTILLRTMMHFTVLLRTILIRDTNHQIFSLSHITNPDGESCETALSLEVLLSRLVDWTNNLVWGSGGTERARRQPIHWPSLNANRTGCECVLTGHAMCVSATCPYTVRLYSTGVFHRELSVPYHSECPIPLSTPPSEANWGNPKACPTLHYSPHARGTEESLLHCCASQ